MGRKHLDMPKIPMEIGVFFNISVAVASLIKYNVEHAGYQERGRLVIPSAASSGAYHLESLHG